MLEKDGIHLETLDSSDFSQPWNVKRDCEGKKPQLIRHEGSGSGGYADHIFKYAAKELFGIDCEQVQYKSLR